MTGSPQIFTITLNGLQWEPGEYLWLRWADSQGADSSGLGLDNLTVATVPEPRTSAMAGVTGALALAGAFASRLRKRGAVL